MAALLMGTRRLSLLLAVTLTLVSCGKSVKSPQELGLEANAEDGGIIITSHSPIPIEITRVIVNQREGKDTCDSDAQIDLNSRFITDNERHGISREEAVRLWKIAIASWKTHSLKVLKMGDRAEIGFMGGCGDSLVRLDLETSRGSTSYEWYK